MCTHRDAFPNPEVAKYSSSNKHSLESAPLVSRIGANLVSAIKRLAAKRESFAVPSIQQGAAPDLGNQRRKKQKKTWTFEMNRLCCNHMHYSFMTRHEIQQEPLFVCRTCENRKSMINSRSCSKSNKPRVKSNVVVHVHMAPVKSAESTTKLHHSNLAHKQRSSRGRVRKP
ncbi:hypothetical protein TSAR_004496 [Trichomalopsis sarcophagae]|uniref:Uncharacterized protein n=1 Tax=Trichomalopsis sarcophagae TaxID=543379 RepID=A0A232ENG4_9HYME|nr:hypothetical protein TSAR_004496 [Trichomalopsis sarcophagae]